ncbi:uncharacterized protein GGS25DRAFT_510700 [Hypoxylon fragiforme]|uniref:uncharacterized protein n=1 Tax=Hypoxylon fragiforme TaxID=63214 RepID=UPI0020C67087|nr:uncharacterized protein GGS25DRAFT_510700 [Hypoxylon fragiforme]KAI2603266.1 hypothetical protein GGS25DRAFT_510700 [Hypoxylon fragiforme]
MADSQAHSFSIQQEFFIATKLDTASRPKPPRFQNAKGKPIHIPQDETSPASIAVHIDRAVGTFIRTATKGHRGDRVVASAAHLDNDTESWHLRDTVEWSITQPPDFRIPKVLTERHMNHYTWKVVVFQSPTFWATEKSFAEVRRVYQKLSDTFWVLTCPGKGMRIRCGRGRSWMPLGELRRIGALLFAADPILAQLHPAHRRNGNAQCLSIRHYSNLAHGWSAAAMDRKLGTRGRAEEAPEELENENQPAVPAPETPKPTRRVFRRGELDGYTFDAKQFSQDAPADLPATATLPGASPAAPLDIVSGARELMSCTSAPTLAALLAHPTASTAYSFRAYTAPQYRQASPSRAPRTVESRQPAGTLHPDLVVLQARVFVQLCAFAGAAPLREFWKLVLDLAMGEVWGTVYDVLDLLAECGVGDGEVRLVEGVMARQRRVVVGKDGWRVSEREREREPVVVTLTAGRRAYNRVLGARVVGVKRAYRRWRVSEGVGIFRHVTGRQLMFFVLFVFVVLGCCGLFE